MSLQFNFFHLPQPKKFDYKPLYYDKEKERAKELHDIGEGKYVPGREIRRAFGGKRTPKPKTSPAQRVTRIITIITLAALLGAIIYFTKLFSIFYNI
ncbi:MAG: hypothetical protein LKI53_02085 [Bacteroidales bacterium]|jgi:hypothetical protein|nr:hypothetical protein [Bacteroidales bacterium]